MRRLGWRILTAWVNLLAVTEVQPSEVTYLGPRNPSSAYFQESFCLDLYRAGGADQPPVAKVAFDSSVSIEGFRYDLAAAEKSGRFSTLNLVSTEGLPLRFQNTTWPPPPPYGSSADLRRAIDECASTPNGLCARGPDARLLDRPVTHQARVAKARKARLHEALRRGESWQVKKVKCLKGIRTMRIFRPSHVSLSFVLPCFHYGYA